MHCADALPWLREQGVLAGASIVTSLPDVTELPGTSLDEWRAFFLEAAALVLRATPPEGAAIFFQTDAKRQGAWVDKAYLVQRAAEECGQRLRFHKIACTQPAGAVTFGRAAYAHLLCFSLASSEAPSRATADVLPDAGAMTWVRAIGLGACRLACRWVLERTPTRTIVDPFCGVGTVLAAANELGLSAVGVELNRKRAARARGLFL